MQQLKAFDPEQILDIVTCTFKRGDGNRRD